MAITSAISYTGPVSGFNIYHSVKSMAITSASCQHQMWVITSSHTIIGYNICQIFDNNICQYKY